MICVATRSPCSYYDVGIMKQLQLLYREGERWHAGRAPAPMPGLCECSSDGGTPSSTPDEAPGLVCSVTACRPPCQHACMHRLPARPFSGTAPALAPILQTACVLCTLG